MSVGGREADPRHPVAVRADRRHRTRDDRHPSPFAGRLQGREERPVVDGQVARHGQPAPHVGAERRFEPAQLAAGELVDLPAQLAEERGERGELGAVARAGGGDDRALLAQAGLPTRGGGEVGREARPPLQRLQPEVEQLLLTRPGLRDRREHAACHPRRAAGGRGSTTVTRHPAAAARHAQDRPITPAPTTAS